MTGSRKPSRRRSLCRRLAVTALAPLLALTATAANAQDAWLTLPPVPTARAALAGASAPCPEESDDTRAHAKETCVYTFGGSTHSPGLTVLNTVEAYRPALNEWQTLSPLPTARDRLAGVAAPCPEERDGDRGPAKGGCVYAIGGSNLESGFLDTVEVYRPAVDEWESVPSLPTPRRSLAGAAAPCPKDVEGLRGICVYAIGGLSEAGSTGAVEAYSPATNRWATLPSLPTPRGTLAGAAAPCPKDVEGLRGTCVYAAGGFNGVAVLDTVEAYSPAANRWVVLPSLSVPRGFLAGTAAPCTEEPKDTCVYAIGGRNFTEVLGTVEEYSPVTNRWATLPSLPTPRDFLTASAAPCPKDLDSDRRYAKDTCVYALGGEIDTTALNTAEAFAIDRDRRTARS
ncbi:kelch repeat-containing protein [Streptomyces sp. R33]|uniref:Kelch repeat-containing protein n=1 Tax=Streptomyces sp. R33 TaxID=3238629 RepID=A0AB39XUJ1_9ACTN